ncbi:hypothetical protein RH915_07510 [Serpentinicella sp. ANB-PHB4]|uniref:hypothetical protein n=1 Tax=Serpentinicella sp. ANB-PHB4 TaxID=3074076 RepID=UPI002858CEF7|nr:hypothetical protein [Serpentinicella sp. ANB-PHB4]MDR5659334.1 hypothetical protein [Serpentinicella sp. ANB-PHB4]
MRKIDSKYRCLLYISLLVIIMLTLSYLEATKQNVLEAEEHIQSVNEDIIRYE